ncbi:MAG: methyltransferase domain-containing protein [Ilumatobacteraceae bacterium]
MASIPRQISRMVKAPLRPLARRVGLAAPTNEWWNARQGPWVNAPFERAAACNVCRWQGDDFVGPFHAEMAACPVCGSVSRDRFLLHSFFSTIAKPSGLRVWETSPRLGVHYRQMMRKHFDYFASDYDLSAHEGDVQIDLQNVALPDESIDVLLTPHVLEHVPDTDRALSEIHRVLKPGGHMFLQVPLQVGSTRVPPEPEFHADNTPVFFNFGWDLTHRLRHHEFTVDVLVTDEWRDVLRGDAPTIASNGDGFHVEDLISSARGALDLDRDLVSIADRATSRVLGALPPYHHVTWRCRKPN